MYKPRSTHTKIIFFFSVATLQQIYYFRAKQYLGVPIEQNFIMRVVR